MHGAQHELAKRLDGALARWRPGARVHRLEPLLGGRSSLTYRVDLAEGGRIVVKLAPAGLAPVRNRDVLRQARLLGALASVPGVRVPALLLEDAGQPPQIPPLFGMSFVEGECFEPIMDEGVLPAPAQIRGRALAAARMLARLHTAHPQDLGLADEPEVRLAEDLERWVRIFDSVDASLQGNYRECAAALRAALPAALPSAVVHGEFRLGNTLCAGGELLAVIDWELWCRGDPRIDLAWFLQFADAASTPSAIRAEAPGMPAPGELLAEYARARGEPLADLVWFHAHARFKQAAITALQCKLNRKRAIPDPVQEANARLIPRFFARVFEFLEKS
jgi:aminoglycoside phosphotransferase (APT) family kinase protein